MAKQGTWQFFETTMVASSCVQPGTSYHNADLQLLEKLSCLEGLEMELAISSNNLILETDRVPIMEPFQN